MRPAPDLGWIDFLKLIIGLLMFASLVALAAIIGLGKVEQQSSFGLQDVLGGLLVAFGAWGQWAFSGGPSRGENAERRGDSVPPGARRTEE